MLLICSAGACWSFICLFISRLTLLQVLLSFDGFLISETPFYFKWVQVIHSCIQCAALPKPPQAKNACQ